MKVELYHASVYGNGARVAEEIKRLMEIKGHQVNVHHIDQAKAKELPSADLYIFGSPTRMGKPKGEMRRFLKKANLPSGTKVALFATHGDAVPDKKTGKLPTEEEMSRWRRTLPMMSETAQEKGWVKVAEKIFLVRGDTMKGPLKEGWEQRAVEFVAQIMP